MRSNDTVLIPGVSKFHFEFARCGIVMCSFDGVTEELIREMLVVAMLKDETRRSLWLLPSTGMRAHACSARARTQANPAGSTLEISGGNPKDEGLRVASFFQVEKNALPGHAERSGAVILET